MSSLKKIILLGGFAILALLAIAYFAVNGWPPEHSAAQGTVGAARRHQKVQIKKEDVKLTDAEVQAFLQSDTFARIQKDAKLRKLLRDPAVQKALKDPKVVKLLANRHVKEALANPRTAKLLSDPKVVKALGDPKTLDLTVNTVLAKTGLDPQTLVALQDPGIAVLLHDTGLTPLFGSLSSDTGSVIAAIGATVSVSTFSQVALEISAHPDLGAILLSPSATTFLENPGNVVAGTVEILIASNVDQ